MTLDNADVRSEQSDEMAARPDELASPSLLRAVDLFDTYLIGVASGQQTLLAWYRALDARALVRQRGHFKIATMAALCGLAAIALALAHHHGETGVVTALELFAMVLAVVAVTFGIVTALHHGWLLDRHKAERLRTLRFRAAGHPSNWTVGADRHHEAASWLDAQVRDIERMATKRQMHQWLEDEEEERPELQRLMLQHTDWDAKGVEDLRRFYVKVRLNSQLDYMTASAHRHRWSDRALRVLPQLLFFVAAGAVGARFGLEWFGMITPVGNTALLMLAVLLPAAGAAIRTMQLSRELERNALRARAKEQGLKRLRDQLLAAPSPAAVLLTLHACEDILESDHREWLRLMIEAEWFG